MTTTSSPITTPSIPSVGSTVSIPDGAGMPRVTGVVLAVKFAANLVCVKIPNTDGRGYYVAQRTLRQCKAV